MKRYGFIPGKHATADNFGAAFNQGLDAGIILDQLNSRVKDLEENIFEEEAHQNNHKCSRSRSHSPATRLPNGNDNRYIEENLLVLQNQVDDVKADIRKLKITSGSAYSMPISYNKSVDEEELKSLRKKVKKLADSTTKACRSLSTGLTDVQQATLNLYGWADKAHDSFGIVSEKLDFSLNICPQAKVYTPYIDHIEQHHVTSFNVNDM